MKVIEHGHPLELIDLHQEYANLEEEEEEECDEEDNNLEDFRCACNRCKHEINIHHRYYYKCMGNSSCHFSLHKFCAELSTRLVHTSHPHSLFLGNDRSRKTSWKCSICQSQHKHVEIHYRCASCDFFIDVKCAIEVGKNIIHHPCHPHLLMCAIYKPIKCHCNACDMEHKGLFYQCTTCGSFTIHSRCAFLPKKVLIQQITDDAFYHVHPLTISYSFPKMEQIVKHHPRCRVCGGHFYDKESTWIYKCDKCMYYAHANCVKWENYMSVYLADLPAGFGKSNKMFRDDDYPHLLHLPFPDETHNIVKQLFFEEIRPRTFKSDEVNLKHIGHQHPLTLVEAQCKDSFEQILSKINSLQLMCHNPMKKIQLLCNGCLRPITSMPYFKCTNEDECCNFALHEWCTRLPAKIENHPGHSQHTLVLMSHILDMFFGVFHCAICRLPCNGFAYCCVECGYYVDACCGFIPEKITHKAHPNHLLEIVRVDEVTRPCYICLLPINQEPFSKLVQNIELFYLCMSCNAFVHPACALLLPKTVTHKYDEHPMHLSYLPIENHKSEYFCEICEEDLNPHASFYHCHDCAQSIHSACAPLILQSETETYSRYPCSTYCFLNIKFGGIHNTHGHPHPLSFAQGIMSDGGCSMCGEGLQYKMIFKCLKCKFAIDYGCCESLNKLSF